MGNTIQGLPIEIGAGDMLTTDGRCRARLVDRGRGIELCSMTQSGATLVVRINAEDGQLTLSVPQGDLKIAAPKGRVVLEGKDVTVTSHGELIQEARSFRARFTRSWSLRAKTMDATAEETTWTVGSWQVHANWLRHQAVHALVVVESTFEQRAERMLYKADKLYRVLSGRTTMRSKDNTSIDGKRVMLG